MYMSLCYYVFINKKAGFNMKLLESGEMYLETILILSETNSRVRSIDVCEYMNFSKPSVSRAVNKLKAEGYINIEADGSLILTEKGKSIADKMYERHKIISNGLIALGVSKDVAVADACKIEHDISDETFEIIKKHMSKLSK